MSEETLQPVDDATEDEAEAAVTDRWAGVELELGKLVVAWSKVDFFVSRVFVGLARLSEPAATLLIRRLKGEGMEQIIFSLLRAWEPASDAEQIGAWMQKVKKVREERNALFHGALVDQFDGVQWQPTNIAYVFDKATGVASLGGPRLSVEMLSGLRAQLREISAEYNKLPAVAHEGITVGD